MAPVAANVTSRVGLVTSYAGGATGYRRELAGQGRLKNVLILAANIVGVLLFTFSGKVDWPCRGTVDRHAYGGGLLGSRLARRVRADVLRGTVIVFGVVVAGGTARHRYLVCRRWCPGQRTRADRLRWPVGGRIVVDCPTSPAPTGR
jgi:hypothetical protein